ncbi:hypothetical protein APUTEX25_001041 [Auxenochlorella protothecoides]|uniref:Folate-biopterin transporter 1, chloroplastic n=1 Tax=Auxenochlorella protothecoides TaxID=3075 RepID=A0A3M7KU97_AUXPR|nr:hypothetical protein APUTEX25_001041 [Auxenochlorella protothecoides]|eukprot:RMZ52922.1 hypothetical protein APUTEX25_001041 [Auxenochlorella protothecoides]
MLPCLVMQEVLEWGPNAVYLVQGLLGLSRLAVFVHFKDDLGLDPAAVAFYTSLSYLPWMIKPLYGFLSDTVPLFGYRRRSYLVLCGLLNCVCWLALAWTSPGVWATVTLLVLGSFSTACADVVADSIVSKAGSLQSLCWGSAAAGSVASAYFSGSLVHDHGPRTVFAVTALFPLLVSAAAAAIPEPRVLPEGKQTLAQAQESAAVQARALWAAVRHPAIYLPTLFVFSWQATPTVETVMTFFQTKQLGFSTEYLGQIRLVGALASLAGVGVYNYGLKATPLRTIFLWTALLGTGLGFTQLILITGTNLRFGISNEVFALADTTLLTVLGQVSFMPVLVLASRLCPEGVEATLFATLMSVLNAGGFTGQALGSALTTVFGVTSDDFGHLPQLVTFVTLCTLAPLPLLRLIPPASTLAAAEEHGRKDG